jgi:ABC-type uncharacterized transport system involved in gliding motility auxiliary subunit
VEELPDHPEEDVGASRTLYSFLEPALDAIGSYAAPIVIAGIIGLIVGIVLVAFVGSLRPYGYITMGFGAVLLVVIGLIYLSTVLGAFLSRTGRYGVNSLIMLGAFLGIIILVNLVSFSNRSRIDVTATQQFSLATDTRNLLRDLDEPIKATAFYQDDPLQQQEEQILRRVKVEDTLSEFKNRSRNFSYEFRDPDLFPEIARNYGVTQYESIVVEGQQSGVTDIIRPTDAVYSQLEQDLYTSILVATGQERKRVYFLAGHGEKSISSASGDGYQSIRSGLERDNYQVEDLRWNPSDEGVSVPDDAALLVIAGPSGELTEAHARALDAYLRGRNPDGTERREGPRLIFLAEPDTDESFRSFLASWGLVVDKGYIRDLDRSVPGSPHTLRVEAYNPEAPPEIVRPRGNPLAVSFMPGVAPIRPISDGGARVPVPLAASSNNSYLIDDIDRTDPITDAGEGSDPSGLFMTALYVQAVGPLGTPPPTSQPRENQIAGIVVFGDSDFVSNSFVDRGSGAAMFLNSANYLLGDFSLVSIRDRQFVFREFNLDQNQFNYVRFSSWFFLPGLMGLMAALVWWVRR